jgi:sugar lactone lactonase YvrE
MPIPTASLLQPRPPRRTCVVPLCLAILALSACERAAAGGWRGSVEQLPGGGVLVKNPAQGVWGQGEGWTLEEDLRIGSMDEAGPALFGEVAAVEADPLGRVWVLERQARELRVFDGRGAHVRTVGRRGGGPGEFDDPIGLAWAPDGRLWVADPGNARFSVFDTAGRYLASHPRRVAGYSIPWRGAFDGEGRLYEMASVGGGGDFRFAVLRFDAALQPLDTLLLPRVESQQFELRSPGGGMMAVGVPFSPGVSAAVDPRGFVWTGITDRWRLHQQRLDGDTVRVVELAAEPVPVTAADRQKALEGLKGFMDRGGRIDEGRIPAHKPAFSDVMVAPDGHLWVRPSLPAGEQGAAFDVLDPEGRYLGRVRLPGGMSRFPPAIVRSDAILGMARDSLDVPYVVRVRIRRGG